MQRHQILSQLFEYAFFLTIFGTCNEFPPQNKLDRRMNTINTNLGQRIKSTLAMRRKTSFFISLTSSKFIISLVLFTNMMLLTLLTLQDLFHKNFIIDLAHHSLRGSVVEYRNSESEGLRFNSSWGLRIFSLFHAREKMKPFSISLLN